MSIDRISRTIQFNNGQRFILLYGPGIEDSFINRNGAELNIEQALQEFLKSRGFRRILFIAPHRPFFFLDEESENLTYPLQSKRQPSSSGFDKTMQVFNNGPLRERMVFQVDNIREEAAVYHGMGDTHATRILDAVMKDQAVPSALVFMQAETTLRYFEDPRTLIGMLGEWLRLPTTNINTCLFVFSAENIQQLSEAVLQLQIPELRAAVANQTSTRSTRSDLAMIGYPGQNEIQAMLRNLVVTKDMPANLAGLLAAEPITARTWLTRFKSQKIITPETLRKNHWISAHRDPQTPALERLNQYIGLEDVKQRIEELYAWLQLRIQNRGQIPSGEKPMLHLIFSGNPGTGKTTIARLMGEIYHDLGLLRRGHVIEVQASDLIADHVGGTALKTNAAVDQALDGVLFIDEAYTFVEDQRGGFGMEAVETLLTRMENDRTRLVVIAAGYPEKMRRFQAANPGLARRFPNENVIVFNDYSADQLVEIAIKMFSDRAVPIDDTFAEYLQLIFMDLVMKKDDSFGNAGEARNLVEAVERRRALRCLRESLGPESQTVLEDLPDRYRQLIPVPPPPIEDLFAEVNHLVGAAPFKQRFLRLVRRMQLEQAMSITPGKVPAYKHLVFQGNPGTGKTTAAAFVARIYHALGLLRTDHCVTVTRSDLVAGYVGQTAGKTRNAVLQAVDGVLFIDEAYSLLQGGENDFGYEAIDTLVKLIEEYPGRLLVIAAGYPVEMDHFLSSNPGLRSRFREPIDFPDFIGVEMAELLARLAAADGIPLTQPIIDQAILYLQFESNLRGRQFGNARAIQNLYDLMKENLAERIFNGQDGMHPSKFFFDLADVPEIPTPVQIPKIRKTH